MSSPLFFFSRTARKNKTRFKIRGGIQDPGRAQSHTGWRKKLPAVSHALPHIA